LTSTLTFTPIDHAKVVEFANKSLKIMNDYSKKRLNGFSYPDKVKSSVLMKRGRALFALGKFEEALDRYQEMSRRLGLGLGLV
jgi:pentatricopeptide repeat protein